MGDGTEQNPYTREDVLRLIEENGGKAKGLNLSEKFFEIGIDLRRLDLSGIILKNASLIRASLEEANLMEAQLEKAFLLDARMEKANLEHAHLEEANLMEAHLEEADLSHAHLEKAILGGAYLEEANLQFAQLEGAKLAEAHLERADLTHAHLEGAHLEYARLEGADLVGANLEGADLWGAQLKRAGLSGANLKGAALSGAYLEGAMLREAEFSAETKLENANWGSYILGEEKERDFQWAEDTYRRLKQWYTNAGIYGIAGEFFFREMTAQRKRIKWWPHPTQKKRLNWWLHPRHRLWSKFVSLICGYGERPPRVILWAVSWVFGLALVYFLIGSTWQWGALWHSLYFSAVSFTALGYGSWLEITNDWIRGIGAFESFIGVFTIALFLVTFTRKMRR